MPQTTRLLHEGYLIEPLLETLNLKGVREFGVEYAEKFHHIGPEISKLDDYRRAQRDVDVVCDRSACAAGSTLTAVSPNAVMMASRKA